MQEIFKKSNIELVRVSINKYSKRKWCFNEYCIFKDGKNQTIKKEYKPDIIRNRKANCMEYKYELLKEYTIIPSKKIASISNDKYEIFMALKKYQPQTFLLNSVLKNKNIKNKYTGQMVLKPIRANGGRGIKKTTIQELLQEREKYIGLEDLFIVQEFKDFSAGYPGIVKGNHDIRLMFAWKKIIEVTLREPKKWDFKSNIWSWGSQSTLNINQIPKELIKLGKQIYKEISPKRQEILSIDFAFCKTENKRYVLEINASPGTRYYQEDKNISKEISKWFIYFFKSL